MFKPHTERAKPNLLPVFWHLMQVFWYGSLYLSSQHSRDGGRGILSSRLAWAAQRDPVQEERGEGGKEQKKRNNVDHGS